MAGKRGQSTLLYFKIIGIVLAAGVFILLIKFLADTLSDTLLEKNYRARDIALLITTIYAAPGQLNYTYDTGGNFEIGIGDGAIVVGDDKGDVFYWYYRPQDMEDIRLEREVGGVLTLVDVEKDVYPLLIFEKYKTVDGDGNVEEGIKVRTP